jgi:hypothetical protein
MSAGLKLRIKVVERFRFAIAVMLRIYCLQQWYSLSDPGAEEALYDIQSMRAFCDLELGRDPDQTVHHISFASCTLRCCGSRLPASFLVHGEAGLMSHRRSCHRAATRRA